VHEKKDGVTIVLLDKFISGVKEFLSPSGTNTINELDLAKCLGRQIEIETAFGCIREFSVDMASRVVDGRLVDHVIVNGSPDAIVQRRLRVGQSMMFSGSIEEYRAGMFVRTTLVKRITIHY
jgi:hypothetical protein